MEIKHRIAGIALGILFGMASVIATFVFAIWLAGP